MRYTAILMLGVCLAGTPVMVGCDRTVSKTESTETNPNTGTTVHKEDTVTKDANGNVTHETTETKDKP